MATQWADRPSLHTIAPSSLLRVLKLTTADAILRTIESSCLPQVGDRFLNLDIGSEGGNDVRMVGTDASQ